MIWSYNYFLYHHGIEGQRWGIRRYQNKDGSLTKAGEKRYGTTENLERIHGDRPRDKSKKEIKKEYKRAYSRKAIIKALEDLNNEVISNRNTRYNRYIDEIDSGKYDHLPGWKAIDLADKKANGNDHSLRISKARLEGIIKSLEKQGTDEWYAYRVGRKKYDEYRINARKAE